MDDQKLKSALDAAIGFLNKQDAASSDYRVTYQRREGDFFPVTEEAEAVENLLVRAFENPLSKEDHRQLILDFFERAEQEGRPYDGAVVDGPGGGSFFTIAPPEPL